MKEIKAYIKPHKLADVTRALHKVEGLSGMSVVNVRGFGRGRAKDSPHKIVEDLADYIPHVKIEIICLEERVEEGGRKTLPISSSKILSNTFTKRNWRSWSRTV